MFTCKRLKTLEEFDKEMILATQFSRDLHITVTVDFLSLGCAFIVEKKVVLPDATTKSKCRKDLEYSRSPCSI
jgi:hypothetical protein